MRLELAPLTLQCVPLTTWPQLRLIIIIIIISSVELIFMDDFFHVLLVQVVTKLAIWEGVRFFDCSCVFNFLILII